MFLYERIVCACNLSYEITIYFYRSFQWYKVLVSNRGLIQHFVRYTEIVYFLYKMYMTFHGQKLINN